MGHFGVNISEVVVRLVKHFQLEVEIFIMTVVTIVVVHYYSIESKVDIFVGVLHLGVQNMAVSSIEDFPIIIRLR